MSEDLFGRCLATAAITFAICMCIGLVLLIAIAGWQAIGAWIIVPTAAVAIIGRITWKATVICE